MLKKFLFVFRFGSTNFFLEPVGHGESADMPKSEIHYEMGELEAFGQTHTQRLGNYNIDL